MVGLETVVVMLIKEMDMVELMLVEIQLLVVLLMLVVGEDF